MKTEPKYDIELSFKNQGYEYIAGVDESGRGPLAGPVVAAAVIIPEGFDYTGINDSKKLSSKKRELFYNIIKERCPYGIAAVDNLMIDAINIREATKLAMRKAVENLEWSNRVDFVIIDGNFVPDLLRMPSAPVIGGDGKSVSIAAASILAKVYRDNLMLEYNKKWPMYKFDENKGYGTKYHREILKMIGPCEIHRFSFSGVG